VAQIAQPDLPQFRLPGQLPKMPAHVLGVSGAPFSRANTLIVVLVRLSPFGAFHLLPQLMSEQHPHRAGVELDLRFSPLGVFGGPNIVMWPSWTRNGLAALEVDVRPPRPECLPTA
jgi:hypothetical protein